MNTYTVPKTSGDIDWAHIPAAQVTFANWIPDAGVSATAQLCWDEAALYVRMTAREENIRAQLSGPLQSVCHDSCLEFFFSPESDSRYFNFEFNPNTALYLGFGSDRYSRFRITDESEAKRFAPKAAFTDGGWEICYKIPLEFIREIYPNFQLKSGLCLTANFYKCGDSTVQPHYLSWNPVETPTPDFHRPEHFGRLILE